MATRYPLRPYEAEFPTVNFPALMNVNARPVLAFDAGTAETAYFTLIAPQGWTGTGTLVITYKMASATTGGVAFDVAVEAVTAGDAVDLDAATSFDAVNTGTTAAVPGTAGFMAQLTITLTNADAMAPADLVRIALTRAVANAADTAVGDCYVLAAELRDAA